MPKKSEEIEDIIGRIKAFCEQSIDEVSTIIVGKSHLLELLMTAILCNGHVLLEGAPGVAKTFMARTAAMVMGFEFKRIQFTPDLLPSDITGTMVYNQKKNEFEFQPGPVFTNILLSDEINRAPAKTQSALLEAMAERQVSIEGKTYILPRPFVVFATQNPIETEGTYALPEAQLDRFLFKLKVDYPSLEEDIEILRRKIVLQDIDQINVRQLGSVDEFRTMQTQVNNIFVDEKILRYVSELVNRARSSPYVMFGASPRASIFLVVAARAYATLKGRIYVEPDDIKTLFQPILNHRVVLTPEAELAGMTVDQMTTEILESVEVPVISPENMEIKVSSK